MRLEINTERKQFTVSRAPEPRTDQAGRQRTEKGSGAPQWQVQLVAMDETGAEVIRVTVAGSPPEVVPGEPGSGRVPLAAGRPQRRRLPGRRDPPVEDPPGRVAAAGRESRAGRGGEVVTVEVEQRSESESVGLVPLGTSEHLWAAYQDARRDWQQAAAVERAHYEVRRFVTDAWQAKRADEEAAWRRSREAYDAWRKVIDGEQYREVT
jgi:hypothetical protein